MPFPPIQHFLRPRFVAGASCAAVLLGSYLLVYHSHYYDSTLDEWALWLCAAGTGLPYFLWVEQSRRKLLQFLKMLLFLVIFLAGLVGLRTAQYYVLSRQRAKDGLVGQAQIVGFQSEPNRGHPLEYVVFAYAHHGTVYRQRVLNDQNLRFGDRLQLYYSASDPKNVVVTAVHHLQYPDKPQ
jgi:hypothetical protein